MNVLSVRKDMPRFRTQKSGAIIRRIIFAFHRGKCDFKLENIGLQYLELNKVNLIANIQHMDQLIDCSR